MKRILKKPRSENQRKGRMDQIGKGREIKKIEVV